MSPYVKVAMVTGAESASENRPHWPCWGKAIGLSLPDGARSYSKEPRPRQARSLRGPGNSQ